MSQELSQELDPSHDRPTPSDRRRHRRASLDVLANRFLDGYPYLCRTTDISSEGLRLRRFQEPDAKAPVRFVGLQFQLPGSSEILTASGEVVFNDEDARAISLRFTQLSPATAAAIDGFVHGVPAKNHPTVWSDLVEP
jgi:c-di-GMP-binding flagellar brake protein YcgR